MTRFEIIVGKPFPVDIFEESVDSDLVRAVSKAVETNNTRRFARFLCVLVLGVALIALIVSFVIGALDGSFNEITEVLKYAALPVLLVLGRHVGFSEWL